MQVIICLQIIPLEPSVWSMDEQALWGILHGKLNVTQHLRAVPHQFYHAQNHGQKPFFPLPQSLTQVSYHLSMMLKIWHLFQRGFRKRRIQEKGSRKKGSRKGGYLASWSCISQLQTQRELVCEEPPVKKVKFFENIVKVSNEMKLIKSTFAIAKDSTKFHLNSNTQIH
jgi:hypothetical protein